MLPDHAVFVHAQFRSLESVFSTLLLKASQGVCTIEDVNKVSAAIGFLRSSDMWSHDRRSEIISSVLSEVASATSFYERMCSIGAPDVRVLQSASRSHGDGILATLHKLIDALDSDRQAALAGLPAHITKPLWQEYSRDSLLRPLILTASGKVLLLHWEISHAQMREVLNDLHPSTTTVSCAVLGDGRELVVSMGTSSGRLHSYSRAVQEASADIIRRYLEEGSLKLAVRFPELDEYASKRTRAA